MHKFLPTVVLLLIPFLLAFDEIRDHDRIDVNDVSYASVVLSVGASQVEAKVGGTRNQYRQRILIYNDSNSTIYFGPSGVTTSGATKGVPLYKKQTATIPIGNVALYLIAGSSANDVIVQELE